MSKLDKTIADMAYVLDALRAYRDIVNSGCCNECINQKNCAQAPELGRLVRYNCFAFVGKDDEKTDREQEAVNRELAKAILFGDGLKKTKNDDHAAVELLDLFTKTFCIDAEVKDDLVFRCKGCPFKMADGKCNVKQFKSKFWPEYKDFGSMGDL